MSEAEQKSSEKKNSKIIIVFAVIIIILLAVIILLLSGVLKKSEPEFESDGMEYEAAVITDEESAKAASDMLKKAQEGNIALEMKLNAFSSNGNDFSCFIANSPSNSYDMYMEITDDADDELIYKSNLIKVGYRIEEFTSSRHYEKGTYPVTVTFYQVEDDHKTEHNRVASAITLNVE